MNVQHIRQKPTIELTASLPKSASDKFRSIKSSITNAILDLWELEQHAIARGDQTLANALFERQLELRRDFHELRRAEIAFMSSKQNVHTLVAILEQVSIDAREIVRKFSDAHAAQNGAREILALLRGLARLVS